MHRYVFPDTDNGSLPSLVQPVIGPFQFQAAEETLYRGIVPAVAFPANGGPSPVSAHN